MVFYTKMKRENLKQQQLKNNNKSITQTKKIQNRTQLDINLTKG